LHLDLLLLPRLHLRLKDLDLTAFFEGDFFFLFLFLFLIMFFLGATVFVNADLLACGCLMSGVAVGLCFPGMSIFHYKVSLPRLGPEAYIYVHILSVPKKLSVCLRCFFVVLGGLRLDLTVSAGCACSSLSSCWCATEA